MCNWEVGQDSRTVGEAEDGELLLLEKELSERGRGEETLTLWESAFPPYMWD